MSKLLTFTKEIRNPQAGIFSLILKVYLVTLETIQDGKKVVEEGYSIGKDFLECKLREGVTLTPAVINSLSECSFYAYRVNSIPASIDKAKELAGNYPSLMSFIQVYVHGSGQSVCPLTESEILNAFPLANDPLLVIDIRPEKIAPVQGKGKLSKIDALTESAKKASTNKKARLVKKEDKGK